MQNNIILYCPKCKSELRKENGALKCSNDGMIYAIKSGVPVFYSSPWYWSEISKGDMHSAINLMKNGTHWKKALKSLKSQVVDTKYSFISNEWRANWHWFLPLKKDSNILDIGCGMGTLSAGLAKRFKNVYSIEPVEERAAFTDIRMKQDNHNNVKVIQTDLYNLPFKENSFDLIVMNGVVEWLGFAENYGSPRDWQVKGLKTARKLLKPGGILYIGIENRIGYDSFLGRLDHSNLRFTALMPRFIADIYCRIVSKKPYRTYIYSKPGLNKLLKDSGFDKVNFLYPLGNYNNPYVVFDSAGLMIPFRRMFNPKRKLLTGIRELAESILAKSGILKHIFSDYLVFAQKSPAFDYISPASSIVSKHYSDKPNSSFCLSRVLPNFFVFPKNKNIPSNIVRFTTESLYVSTLRKTKEKTDIVTNILKQSGINVKVPKIIDVKTNSEYTYSLEEFLPSKPFGDLDTLTSKELKSVESFVLDFANAHKNKSNGENLKNEIMQSYKNTVELFPEFNEPEFKNKFVRSLDYISNLSLIPCPQHGDFWAENLGLTKDGVLAVYDWATYGNTALPFFDALHFSITLLLRYCKDVNIDFDVLRSLNINSISHSFINIIFDKFGYKTEDLNHFVNIYCITYIGMNSNEIIREPVLNLYSKLLKKALKGIS